MNELTVSAQEHVIESVQLSPFMRALGVIPAALLMTMCLLYAMHYLIHNDYPEVVDDPIEQIPEFIMDTPPPIIVREAEPLVRPVEQQLPPALVISEIPELMVETEGIYTGEKVIVAKPPINGAVGLGGQMAPFIKIAPQYPSAAANKGIEGYVDVIFDVTELGSTDNIRITGYVPSAVFNNSVMKAVKGWKYKPNEVNGVAVRTPDVRDRIRFTLEK